ncbi:MAG: CarD family transcriptional regulator [Spirochaetia bacterium]|nr:helicase-related protein [Spirochaetota bacterium]MDW8112285.1 CarD family transcriptional regulator [Spirochaetia bacterium]
MIEEQLKQLYKILFSTHKVGKSVIITSEEEFDSLKDIFLKVFTKGLTLPSLDVYPYTASVPPIDRAKERVKTIRNLNSDTTFILTTIEGLLLRTISKEIIYSKPLTLRVGESVDLRELKEVVDRFGYERLDRVVDYGEYAIKGSVFEIFTSIYRFPIRVITDFGEIKRIRAFDPETSRGREELNFVEIYPPYENDFYRLFKKGYEAVSFYELTENPTIFSLIRIEDLQEEYQRIYDTISSLYSSVSNNSDFLSPQEVIGELPENISIPSVKLELFPMFIDKDMLLPNYLVLSGYISAKLSKNKVFFISPSERYTKKAGRVFSKYGISSFFAGRVEDFDDLRKMVDNIQTEGKVGILEGFNLPRGVELDNVTIITISELFNREFVEYDTDTVEISSDELRDIHFFTNIKEGDYVVHSSYGIGIFRGLVEIKYFDSIKEFAKIEFDGGDSLYIPPEQFNLISKYIGSEEPKLSKLKSNTWKNVKKRVRDSILKFSRDLLRLKALRQVRKKSAFRLDYDEYEMLEDSFPYEETPDQIRALEEIKSDLASQKVMERVICGDVGFGKTEIAIRAAFLHILNGYQVMVLVPTTILAEQHYKTFTSRLSPFGVKIGIISRLRKESEIRRTIEEISKGSIDLVIGTHALISGERVIDKFKSLSLIVIDEEHKFGVEHKEEILKGREDVNVLMLSATPIPRTLGMSMGNLRDISIISTPPFGRKPIKTFIVEWKDEVIRDAVEREIKRGGQVLVVNDRIEGLEKLKRSLVNACNGLVGNDDICILHGQLGKIEIENVFFDFVEGKYRVMISTTISESGLDIPNVNTVIINNAHNFGLADLHQIRGRVGRRDVEGYAYFIYPSKYLISELQMKRLSVIEEHSDLGAGFRIALKDLELRGAGNLLGKEQHGNINSVGYVFYVRMLSDILNMISQEQDENEVIDYSDPVLYFKSGRIFPEDLDIPTSEKMEIMLKLNIAYTERQLEYVLGEIQDRYGNIPEGLYNLSEIVRLRLYLKKFRIEEVYDKDEGILIRFSKTNLPDADRLFEIMMDGKYEVEMIPEDSNGIILKVSDEGLLNRIRKVQDFVKDIFNQKD